MVVYYILKDEETKERVEEMRVGENIDSNLLPEKVTIKGREREREKQGWKKRFCRGI